MTENAKGRKVFILPSDPSTSKNFRFYQIHFSDKGKRFKYSKCEGGRKQLSVKRVQGQELVKSPNTSTSPKAAPQDRQQRYFWPTRDPTSLVHCPWTLCLHDRNSTTCHWAPTTCENQHRFPTLPDIQNPFSNVHRRKVILRLTCHTTLWFKPIPKCSFHCNTDTQQYLFAYNSQLPNGNLHQRDAQYGGDLLQLRASLSWTVPSASSQDLPLEERPGNYTQQRGKYPAKDTQRLAQCSGTSKSQRLRKVRYCSLSNQGFSVTKD